MTDYPTQSAQTFYLSWYPEIQRRVYWDVDSMVLRYFTVVSSFANPIGAFNVGYNWLKNYDYNVYQVKNFYQRCIGLGLLRCTFEARGLASWYQVHPALLRMPYDLRMKALAHSSVPYAPLHNVDPFDPSIPAEIRQILLMVDPRATGKFDQWISDGDQGYRLVIDHPMLDGDQWGDQVTGEVVDHRVGGGDQYGDQFAREAVDQQSLRGDQFLPRFFPQQTQQADQIRSEADQKQIRKQIEADRNQIVPLESGNALSARLSANANGSRTAQPQNGNGAQFAAQSAGAPTHYPNPRVANPTPQPPAPSGERPQVKRLKNALTNQADETLAQLLSQTSQSKIPVDQARGYVVSYGAARVTEAIRVFIGLTPDERANVQKPGGYLTKLIQNSTGQPPPPTWEQRRTYDMSDPESCRAAMEDTTLSDDERSVYALALQAAQRASGYAGDEWYLPKGG